MTKADYDKYIQAGVALRRNTYRGKDITSYYNGTEKVNGKDLFKQISDGTFDDIYVGDYIVSSKNDASNKKIIWLIADIDNYYNQGDKLLKTHHVTIIPAYKLSDNRMNATNTITGGYKGSEMYQTTLNNIYSQYIAPDFCKSSSACHIITYRNIVSNEINATSSNQWGSNSGATSNWSYESRQLDLMSEVNVYGTTVWSSSGHDVGLDNRQYAIFQLRPELVHQDLAGNVYMYWLKTVSTAASFALVSDAGEISLDGSTTSLGVRPRFLID